MRRLRRFDARLIVTVFAVVALVLLALLIPTFAGADLIVREVAVTWDQPAPEGFTGIMEFWAGSVNYGAVPWLVTGVVCPVGWCFWIGSDLSGLDDFTIAGAGLESSIQPDGHVLGTLHVNGLPPPEPPVEPVGVPEPGPWLLMLAAPVMLAARWVLA
jgi:hypothetical protein